MKETPREREWEKEFEDSYGDFFTENNDCKGCKKSFDGDTRHRRHCIVDVKSFIRQVEDRAVERFRISIKGKIKELDIGRDEEADKKRDSLKWYHDGYNEAISDAVSLLTPPHEEV